MSSVPWYRAGELSLHTAFRNVVVKEYSLRVSGSDDWPWDFCSLISRSS